MHQISLLTTKKKESMVNMHALAFTLPGEQFNPFKDSMLELMQTIDDLLFCIIPLASMLNTLTEDDYITYVTLSVPSCKIYTA
jgi:hypothetical protein